jgi:hypothetical protein
MRTVNFLKAGRYTGGMRTERVFFTSNSRRNAKGSTVFHRNEYSSLWRIPLETFRANFCYEASTGIYRTLLTYADIEPYLETISH